MINKVILMGRLTADPELNQTQSGIAVCKFTVAANRPYKSSDGSQQADFISCQAWRATAEFVSRYFAKGRMIIVEGTLQNNNYTDKSGVKHYSYIVIAEKVNFGESKSQSGQNLQPATSQNAEIDTDLSEFEEILGDGDVPF